jgi:hypothetical protein
VALLNTADNIFLGADQVDAAYLGAAQVWPIVYHSALSFSTTSAVASTPDSPAWNLSGLMQCAARIRMDAISNTAPFVLSHFSTDNTVQGFRFYWSTGGRMLLSISPDGVTSTVNSNSNNLGQFSALISVTPKLWIGWEYDPVIGDVTYWSAPDSDVMPTIWSGWTQFGQTRVVPTGVDAFDNGEPLTIGPLRSSGNTNFRVYEVCLYDDGVLLASPAFWKQAPGTTSFDDDQGNTWTLSAGAAIDAA